MHELKNYQIDAIEQLKYHANWIFQFWNNWTIIFKAPTWAWKTITMVRFILDYINNTDIDLCFLWISIWKWDLQVQSYKSAKREIWDSLECSLLENEFFWSRDIIQQNEIVFLNREKIRKKDKETNKFSNVIMRDNEQWSFPEILENTRNCGRKIVLIIDESHIWANSDRVAELKNEIIKPEIVIEVSATPILKDWPIVQINPIDVINEWMIKKEIIINKDIEEAIINDENDKTSEQLVLETAYMQSELLKQKYTDLLKKDEIKTKITPLTLIQIPNSSYWEQKKESVMKFLEWKWITTQNWKLAIWLSDETINKDSDSLLPLDWKVEYLIFKMAVDTGWDCPRAQILVKFRETTSITFDIQTVWRILRMPEWKHYSDEDLNRAYVYSNIQSIAIKKETYNPNIIKSLIAKPRYWYNDENLFNIPQKIQLKEVQKEKNNPNSTWQINNVHTTSGIENFNTTKDSKNQDTETKLRNQIDEQNYNDIIEPITNSNTFNTSKNQQAINPFPPIVLESYYKKRVDYWDVTSEEFYKVYKKVFCEYFGIDTENIADAFKFYEININLLEKKWIDFSLIKKDSIISDAHIKWECVDNSENIDVSKNLVDIYASESDLENIFDNIIKSNLWWFAPIRSVPIIKNNIFRIFKEYLNILPANKWIVKMQNLVINNENIFSEILNSSIESYKIVHEQLSASKDAYQINKYWQIPRDKNYNPNTNQAIDSKLSYFQPLYIELKDWKINQLELDFIHYLDQHEDSIEYFRKNWSEHMNSNFGIKKRNGWVFQPDFLIQFKNWKIWIFDTKAGKWFNESDNQEKSEALQQYIVDKNNKWKNLIWWLVIKNNKDWNFYYYNRNLYQTYEENPSEWINFNTLLE